MTRRYASAIENLAATSGECEGLDDGDLLREATEIIGTATVSQALSDTIHIRRS
jgi:hypothetical protein